MPFRLESVSGARTTRPPEVWVPRELRPLYLQPITTGGVTYREQPWHRECFVCTACKKPLSGQRFTSRDEFAYCLGCFCDLYAKKCAGCANPISGECPIQACITPTPPRSRGAELCGGRLGSVDPSSQGPRGPTGAQPAPFLAFTACLNCMTLNQGPL